MGRSSAASEFVQSCSQAEAEAVAFIAMWDWRDAWILQSVVYAGREGALRSILASADAINVDVPPRDELERVVQRLQAASLVTAERGRVRATRVGKRLVRKSSGWRGGSRSITPKIEAALQESVPPPGQPGDWSLAEVEWRDAYEAYAIVGVHPSDEHDQRIRRHGT